MKNFLFSTNTGYFIKNIRFYYDNKPYLGFELCRGYKILGISGCNTLALCCDRKRLDSELIVRDIKISEIENYPKDFPLTYI
jgi:hypothetical protein